MLQRLPELEGFPKPLKVLTGPSRKERETLTIHKVYTQSTHPIQSGWRWKWKRKRK